MMKIEVIKTRKSIFLTSMLVALINAVSFAQNNIYAKKVFTLLNQARENPSGCLGKNKVKKKFKHRYFEALKIAKLIDQHYHNPNFPGIY